MTVDFAAAATAYLADRRARGYRLEDHAWLLRAFLDRLAAAGATTITVADAVAFAVERADAQPVWHAARLRAVRGLAAHVHGLDPHAAELIPAGLIVGKVTRRIPYLYSDDEITRLMVAAKLLSPPMLAASLCTLIGLLAVTGMRGGEASALSIEDVHIDERTLMVTGKYGRQRLVPLHATTMAALAEYLEVRASRAGPEGPLLVGERGRGLNMNAARAAFRAVVNHIELPAQPGCGVPRLHDLRHTFAVNSLIDAHRQGVDVDARIAALAVVLGHANPTHTYWYLTASAELMAVVSERMAAPHQGGRR